MFVLNNVFWYRYFNETWYSAIQIMGFFHICIWLIPLVFLITLTINEETLPMQGMHSSTSRSNNRKEKRSIIEFNYCFIDSINLKKILGYFKTFRKQDSILPIQSQSKSQDDHRFPAKNR